VGWILGTAIGVLIGGSLGNPDDYGLNALFPAFFIALLFEEVRDRRRAAAALGGAAIALVLTPLVPAGLPILAAVAAAIAIARVRA
jgi:predicted branched-subunit amino acid permease